jgi:excisionase family DNA binding protein
MNNSEGPYAISVPEAAWRLGISRSFAYQLVQRGELPSVRFGRRIAVPRQELERFIRSAVRDWNDARDADR